MKKAYPEFAAAGGLFDVFYYNAMEALAQALEQVEGDLSDEHAQLREALANLELDARNQHRQGGRAPRAGAHDAGR